MALAALVALLTLAADVSAQSGGIELEQQSADRLVLTWPEVAGADQYALRWYRAGRLASAQTVTLPATTRRYRIDDLRARSLYFLRVQALSADGAVLQTWNRTALPFASDARWWHARLRSAEGSLHLSWEPPAAWAPDGYRVRWRHVDTLTWQPTVELGADVRAYTITGLTAGQSYTVRLSAFQIAAPARLARPSNITAETQPPPLPPALTAQTAASGSVKLSWEAGDGGAASWQYRQQPSGGSWSAWTTIPAADAVTASPTVSGLPEDERHDFQLRAVYDTGPSPQSETANAVAGLRPTLSSYLVSLSHKDMDIDGGAVTPGSYAFLTDINDLSSAARSAAEIAGAEALLVNTQGSNGQNHTALLAGVEPYDYFTWSQGDCFYSFYVGAAKPDPPPPARKLLHISLYHQDGQCEPVRPGTGQGAAEDETGSALLKWSRHQGTIVGPDGIRILWDGIAEGGFTYRLTDYAGPTSVILDIPVGLQLRPTAALQQTSGSLFYTYFDAESGVYLTLNPQTGEGARYWVENEWTEKTPQEPAGLVMRFAALIASIRIVPLP